MKYHIKKNSVQETLVIPLYGRKMCSELYPHLFRDDTAARLIEQIDYDFSELAKKSQSTVQQFGFIEAAMRQNDRGYMLGYQKLDDPSVKGFYRFLAKVGDGMMKMQIVKIAFQ